MKTKRRFWKMSGNHYWFIKVKHNMAIDIIFNSTLNSGEMKITIKDRNTKKIEREINIETNKYELTLSEGKYTFILTSKHVVGGYDISTKKRKI